MIRFLPEDEGYWAIVDRPEAVHVFRICAEAPHEPSPDCWCKPRRDPDLPLYSHNESVH